MSDKRTILTNATVLDVVAGKLLPNHRVVISGGKIERVEPAANAAAAPDDTVIDCKGMTVMPGLCDAHVHVNSWTANISDQGRASPSYTAARTTHILNGMLMRGFTTVRDEAGADYGIQRAVNEDFIAGPRVLICGRALSQTGGHGDSRGRGEMTLETLSDPVSFSQIVDGVDEVRRACRHEIRKGANHIKLMLSGGVASPTDRLTNSQFSLDEIRAAVEEAEMAGLYVTGHSYTVAAVNRAIQCGVRSLEHCNLIDQSSVELFVKHGAFMVPTLVTYESLAKDGVKAGLPKELEAKIYEVLDQGLKALDLAYHAGVKIAYGTDLLGAMHKDQLQEFSIRNEVQPAIEIIRGATTVAADLFKETGQTGVVASGARADLLVVDGDPAADLRRLQDPARYLKAIMKDGKLYKNELA